MKPEEKECIEKFALSLGVHDPWNYTGTCVEIMNGVDYEAPAELIRSGEYFDIKATMKNGRDIVLGYHDGAWTITYAKPGETLTIMCAECHGTRLDTCNNPEHAFIAAMPGDIGRIGCPGCDGQYPYTTRAGREGKPCQHCTAAAPERGA